MINARFHLFSNTKTEQLENLLQQKIIKMQ
jgi:hypothetical protein